MNRQQLIHSLQEYRTSFTEESKFLLPFLEILTQNSCYLRTHLPGHVTGSAWIVDRHHTHALLVHHAKLNKWMQPGGHADGDENILQVALREAEEETGIEKFILVSQVPFDLDIHLIPERKDFPQHFHYDVRFLLEADIDDKILVSEESHDVKWIPLQELESYTHERSVLRMKEKLL